MHHAALTTSGERTRSRTQLILSCVVCLLLVSLGACAAESGNGSGGGNGNGKNGNTAGSSGTAGSGAGVGGGTAGTSTGTAGTGPDGFDDKPVGDCPAISQTADNTVQPVDIIIAIDTSGSMGQEINFVQQEMNAFSQQIIDSGVDARVIMLATPGKGSAEMAPAYCQDPAMAWAHADCWSGAFGDFSVCIAAPLGSGMCPEDSKLPQYVHVNQTVGSTDALQVIVSSYAMWKQHLRTNSVKQFLIITDDNAEDFIGGGDPATTSTAFVTQVKALDPDPLMFADFHVNAIYCFTQCAAAASIGTVYDLLVPQTMGTRGDLCLQDFKPVFDELAKQVAKSVKVSCEWDIPPVPSNKTFDRGQTNVKVTIAGTEELIGNIADPAGCKDKQAWYYDIADATKMPTKVLACPATCDRIQAAPDVQVDVLFDCPTVMVPVE